MDNKDGTKREPDRNIPLIPVVLLVLVVLLIIWLPGAMISRERTMHLAKRLICKVNLGVLGAAFADYAAEDGGKYPVPDKWCDLLLRYDDETEKLFKCPAGKNQLCSYALNPNCEPNSPPDVVLLFETKGGWNQCGGAELLTLENHKGEGCNVLFNDGHVEFVMAEEIGELKWK